MKQLDQSTIDEIAGHYREIIRLIGEDPSREGLVKTPARAAKALAYCVRGYRQNSAEVVNDALFESAPDAGLIVVRDIEFYSLCEHHILPFFGTMSVGYVPGSKIVGLSKVARIVDMFARRLQVQERLTKEVAEELTRALDAKGVIVRCSARHLCMAMRGVQKQESSTVTVAATGVLKDSVDLRQEFFSAIS